jgi:hypothetical protein
VVDEWTFAAELMAIKPAASQSSLAKFPATVPKSTSIYIASAYQSPLWWLLLLGLYKENGFHGPLNDFVV